MAEDVEIPEAPQVPATQTGELDKLYDVVSKAGLYTKSKEDFKQKYSTPDAINKLYDVTNQAGLYTKSKDDFYSKYYPDLQKKNGVGNGTSQSLVSTSPLPSEENKKGFLDFGTPTNNIAVSKPQSVSVPKTTDLPNIKVARDNTVNQRIKAKRGVYDATLPKPTKEEIAKETDFVDSQIKNGNLVPDKNSKGEPVLKHGTGFLQSFNDALENEHTQNLNNTYVANLPKDKAIEYLNNKRQYPEIMGNTEKETAPNGVLGKVGDFLGSNIGMIAKGTAGALGGAAAALETGGASFGTFLATVKDMAHGGYANALEKNYNGLKEQHPNMSDTEAYDKAHKAALVGEAINIGTGAVLAHSLPTPKATIPATSVLESLGHAIKTSPKVIGSSAAGSLLNDITSNLSGNKVSGGEMANNAKEQAANMAVMHFGLWGLTEPSRIPSYIRPQIENVVSSAPREEVKQFYDGMEQAGAVPEGTTSKVLSKLDEFSKQKQVVNDMPLNEEQKASITGKLLQRKKIEEENSTLKNYGGSFNARVEANNKQLEGIDNEIDGIIKTGNVAKFENDNLTGEPLTQAKPHEELTAQERNGIVVPKEYGGTDVVEVGEGENKTYKPKAFYTNNSGGLKMEVPIPIEEKIYTDKDKAQKAADEALGKHYYENGMPHTDKPLAKEKSITVIKPEDNQQTNVTTISPKDHVPETQKSGVSIILPKNEIQQPTEVKGTSTEEVNPVIGTTEKTTEGMLGTEQTISPQYNSAGKTIGVSHNSLKDLAKRLGMPEIERGKRLTPEEMADRGRKLYNAGADIEQLEKDFKNGKQPTADDISVARSHLENLDKVADAMEKKWGSNSKQFNEAKSEADRFAREVNKPMGTVASEPFTALQGERDADTDSFSTVQRKVEETTGNPLDEKQQQKVKQLTSTNEKLKVEGDEAEKKLIEETDKEFNKKETDKPKDKKYTEQAKKVADSFRKLKVKEFKFFDENGNEVPIEKMGVSWNDLVEVGAKVIEKTGEVADGVKAIIDEIRDTNFYNTLSDKKKEDLQKQLEEHFQSAIEKTPEYKKVKRLESELEKLKQGTVKGKQIKTEDSPRAKELKDQIFEEKKKLGLIPSKVKIVPETDYGMEETPEVNVRRLEKELEDLQKGIAKQTSPSRELTDREKELKEQIQDEKEKLGLVKSKEKKPLTEAEQQELSDKKKEDLQKQLVDKKGNKFSIDEAKNIWNYAKETYLDKGVKYRDMISLVADDLGLTWRQVSEALISPKLKPISDKMWEKQAQYKRNQTATKNWIEDQTKNPYIRALKNVSGKFRSISVFGHGGIFIGTHAGMTFFQPSTWKHTIPAFFRAWKFAYGNKGNYERAMEELKNRSNYTLAQRAGLKNNPDRINAEEYQASQKWLGKLGGAGEHGFNAIKVLRQDLFDNEYNKLTAAEKASLDKDGVPIAAKNIAKLMNLATGATNITIPETINEVTFAGGMEAARWGKLIRNPIKATTTAIKAIKNPESVSAADKVFAKVWAKRVGQQLATYTGALLANAAIQNTINPSNKVNLTDPSKPDWMKFKFGDITIDPTSGMLGVINFIKDLGTISEESQKDLKGDSRKQAYGKKIIGYARGKLAPLYSTASDLAFQSDFNDNPLPFSSDKPKPGRHTLGWVETLWQKAPLPVAEAAKVTYESALENGADKMQLDNVMKGILMGAISGGTGFRVGEHHDKPTPFTEADNKEPAFKYFLDKGLELPNTAPTSETIKDEEAGQKKKLSEYPKEKQDEYNIAHKEYLKDGLQKVIDKGYVYVDKFGDISINPADKHEEIELSELKKEQLAQVLHLSQASATQKAKKQVFKSE